MIVKFKNSFIIIHCEIDEFVEKYYKQWRDKRVDMYCKESMERLNFQYSMILSKDIKNDTRQKIDWKDFKVTLFGKEIEGVIDIELPFKFIDYGDSSNSYQGQISINKKDLKRVQRLIKHGGKPLYQRLYQNILRKIRQYF